MKRYHQLIAPKSFVCVCSSDEAVSSNSAYLPLQIVGWNKSLFGRGLPFWPSLHDTLIKFPATLVQEAKEDAFLF